MTQLLERTTETRRRPSTGTSELVVALLAFAAMSAVVLTKTARMLEPDDYAYRASIIALSQGHVLLTNAQYHRLLRSLSGSGGIAQWDNLKDGNWISEKNPGYPFFAVVFQWLGALRIAPLFYGALGCAGLFLGGRRWLGRWGGTFAVVLFCTSGAALAFAWRSTMPSFTDASLIAAGLGALIWAVLAVEATWRIRTVAGLLGFLALEGAVFVRYTNVVVLIVAAVAVVGTSRLTRTPRGTLWWWTGSIVAFAVGDMLFNEHFYGGALTTGYAAGEITFSLSALLPNLEHMPTPLVEAFPLSILALVAVAWLAVRAVRAARGDLVGARRSATSRDALVGGTLAIAWAGLWGLYALYTWTAQQGTGQAIHVIRFYLPALGAMALLGAWFLVQLPRWLPATILALLVVLGGLSFQSLTGAQGGPGGGPRGGPGAGGPVGPGSAQYGPPSRQGPPPSSQFGTGPAAG